MALDLRMPALDRDGGPRELIAFALDNLGRMQLDSALFCEELVAGDPAPRGTNLRYTLMTWLGLHKAQATGYAHDFDLDRIRHALLARLDAPQLRPGDLGLHLWVDALAGREHGDDLLARLRGALAREGGMQAREGMEIAWIVLGLAHQVTAGAGAPARDLLRVAVDHALGRQHMTSGLFAHTGAGGGFRRRFPNFATQIYSVLALATMAAHRLDGGGRALGAAKRASASLQELQLPDGGWPWLYDVRTGRVVERYEVYTVHQTAMAPMAMLQLTEVSGERSHADAAARGLEWVQGRNELGVPMLLEDDRILCRSIRRRSPWSRAFLYGNTAASTLTGAGRALGGGGTVELNRTDRPYHLGWVLEAWCGREDMLA